MSNNISNIHLELFDLYIILKDGYTNLKEIISGGKQVYNGAFDEKLFLEQLSITPLPTPDEVRHYFEELVKTYTK